MCCNNSNTVDLYLWCCTIWIINPFIYYCSPQCQTLPYLIIFQTLCVWNVLYYSLYNLELLTPFFIIVRLVCVYNLDLLSSVLYNPEILTLHVCHIDFNPHSPLCLSLILNCQLPICGIAWSRLVSVCLLYILKYWLCICCIETPLLLTCVYHTILNCQPPYVWYNWIWLGNPLCLSYFPDLSSVYAIYLCL